MRPLENILDIRQFTAFLTEGKKDPQYECPWWDDCVTRVEQSICQDYTTTKDNLHEKARNYALNCLVGCTEVSYLDKDKLADAIADEVETFFKDKNFDQRPPAGIVAQAARKSIAEEPENRFIKLR